MAGHMRLVVWQEAAFEHANGSGDAAPFGTLEPHEVGALVDRYAWWGQYSAPGYMDQTDISGPYVTADEAALETFRSFGLEGLGDEITPDEQECIDMLIEIGVPKDVAEKQVLS